MKGTIPVIAVTGSSGFLGQHLLHSLIKEPLLQSSSSSNIQQGCHIHALCGSQTEGLLEAATQHIANKNTVTIQVHKLDLTNTEQIKAWLSSYASKIDVCIHLAAMSSPRTCQDNSDLARAVNVPQVFFQGLLQAHKIPVIAISTDQVYDGSSNHGAPYQERDPAKPVNVYGCTKVEMEEYLMQLSSSSSNKEDIPPPAICLRSSIILGPKAPLLPDQAHSTFLHFCQGREGQSTEFYKDEFRSVIAVDNVVDVLRWFAIRLLQSTTTMDTKQIISSGIYNMGGPQKVSRVDMAQAVFRHFGYKEDCLVISEKATLPPPQQGGVPSPLDITMDSSALYQLVNEQNIQWKDLKDMVKWTFSTLQQ